VHRPGAFSAESGTAEVVQQTLLGFEFLSPTALRPLQRQPVDDTELASITGGVGPVFDVSKIETPSCLVGACVNPRMSIATIRQSRATLRSPAPRLLERRPIFYERGANHERKCTMNVVKCFENGKLAEATAEELNAVAGGLDLVDPVSGKGVIFTEGGILFSSGNQWCGQYVCSRWWNANRPS
jgi:hypothetical protein